MLIKVPAVVQTAVMLACICIADAIKQQALVLLIGATNMMMSHCVLLLGQTDSTMVNVVERQPCYVCQH